MGEYLYPKCDCYQCRAPRLEHVSVAIRAKGTKTILHAHYPLVGPTAVLAWVARQVAAMSWGAYEIRIGKKGKWIS